jgi:septum formation protein
MRLVLASTSPRRAELLRAAGIPFDVVASHADEAVAPGEAPEAYVQRVAQAKAEAVAPKVAGRAVLGADTIVVVDRHILGKPPDIPATTAMLRSLSGRQHVVLTGMCLLVPTAGQYAIHRSMVSTVVEFAQLSDAEIAWYAASGEPVDKAGAYAIQGLASRFVTRIDGSYSNVVGLPVAEVYRLCRHAGVETDGSRHEAARLP